MEQSKGFGSSKVTENSFNSDDIDIFNPVITEGSVISGRTVCFRPISENIRGPFQFNIEPQAPDQYLQLRSVKLAGTARILKSDGTVLTTADDVSIVNLFPHSLFKGHEVEINNILVTDLSSFMSHYQSYIQTILSYNSEAQRTHLRAQRFVPDTPGLYDAVKTSTKGSGANEKVDFGLTNQGYYERAQICKTSKSFDFVMPICSDILQCDRLLHSSCSMKIKLLREADTFSLLTESSTTSYKIALKDLRVYAHYVKVAPNIVKQHMTLMQSRPLIYPISRTQIKEYTMSSGEKTKYISNLFNGRLPKNIIIGMVKDDAANAVAKYNPWNFQNFKIQNSYLSLNGEIMPSDTLKPDFSADLYMREYMHFMSNIGIDCGEDHGNYVTPEQFKSGSFFMAYDLSAHMCNMLHTHPSQEGNIDLVLNFKEALDTNVRLIVYASTDAQIEIKPNNVSITYA